MTDGPKLVFADSPINGSLLPGPVAWEWIIAAAVALVAILAVLVIQRFRSRSAPAATNRQDAYRQAMQSLDHAATLPARAAAIEASLAIRTYLCAVASDPSLYETHEEFLARHPSIANLPAEMVTSLAETLKRLAEIKYRRAEEPADASPLLDQSRDLLLALDQCSAA